MKAVLTTAWSSMFGRCPGRVRAPRTLPQAGNALTATSLSALGSLARGTPHNTRRWRPYQPRLRGLCRSCRQRCTVPPSAALHSCSLVGPLPGPRSPAREALLSQHRVRDMRSMIAALGLALPGMGAQEHGLLKSPQLALV